MSNIRIQKIDGVEFVTYKDYINLEQENKDLNKQIEQFKKGVKAGTNIIERLEEENQKLNIIIENTKIEQEADRKHIEELEEENKKLKAEKQELEYLGDINEELKEENQKLKEELNEWVNGAINSLRETPKLLNHKE